MEEEEMKKLGFDSPKEEVERILKQSSMNEIEESLESGAPVRAINNIGIYDRYKDGTKVYVKKFIRGSGEEGEG
ncbi:hypothetical protein P4U99_07510 [Brevibacillus agri]|uniref:hypothetical protein n=1 Tax=Brevibacillus TaxID=55080 RepID=UPI002E2438B0|nr:MULTISPECIES: hypothetical protein [Brevibacillus]MED1643035.1 hypothetical protein [Brevibacillus agri]MED2009827.1 hypothetical protein [Brevibacillus borstelensis]MED1653641.1 hypothetical protein [Brevibacillus agri]MED1687292.1 hypothetical protein [Brevibacillus agri]MED1693865.1 hypothetical protein [Brevibacillus agri]